MVVGPGAIGLRLALSPGGVARALGAAIAIVADGTVRLILPHFRDFPDTLRAVTAIFAIFDVLAKAALAAITARIRASHVHPTVL